MIEAVAAVLDGVEDGAVEDGGVIEVAGCLLVRIADIAMVHAHLVAATRAAHKAVAPALAAPEALEGHESGAHRLGGVLVLVAHLGGAWG